MLSDRICPTCRATLVPTMRSDARYCGRPCKSRATWERRRALLAAGRAALAAS